MLKSQANWKFTYTERIEQNEGLKRLSLSTQTERLLLQRGINTPEKAELFLKPQLEQLHAPSLLKDIDKACQRILQAIEQGESILVFGDYDADGVSSTTVMVEALREVGAICDYYIPNRFTEGYGPNEQAFTEAYKQGYQVIITVDTGIAAVHEAEVAKQLGIDLIITDHHEVQETLPNAYAIVHPKCSENYPFKELAGVGVAFKLAQHLLGYFPSQLLDLVVIGTIADLVPLLDENRVLASHGLQAISNSKRPGIKALRKLCNIEGSVTEEHIGFQIGPRINAVGRLQDASAAVELLLTEDPEEATELAQMIQQLNQERQKIVADIAKEAEAMVEEDDTGSNDHVIVVAKEGWNQGVLGIVASKLVRTYDRPAIVLTIQPEKQQAKGSARSIPAFDLFSNCMEFRDTFIHFGGHAQAAGMTLTEENIDLLRMKLNQAAASQLTEEDYKQELTIDATVEVNELDLTMIQEIQQLAPFGMGNPKPLFHVQAVPSEVRQIGSQKNHLKLNFHQDGSSLDCIGFGMGGLYDYLSPQSTFDAVGELGINEWNGKKKIQLMLKDLAVNDWQLFDHRGSRHWHKSFPVEQVENTLAIHFQALNDNTVLPNGIPLLEYTRDNRTMIEDSETKTLVILDLPTSLDHLIDVLQAHKPEKIYACYRLAEGQFFNSIPTREDFKWFYAMVLKRKKFDLSSEIQQLAKHKGWKPGKIKFMAQVFYELGFVTMDNTCIYPSSNPAKKDLQEAPIYQTKLKQMEIEAILYYSTYQELKAWYTEQMQQVGLPKEEVIHGL
ncbi:single-stranded-DNA-specific exonuclease RecJ [Aquibacillus sediminis]|uniref:single-stranded-DNA-specific exonuclease RecJ n=1 Tax=Aquibacillus sediminis TaxID=2574734 RepID=UPI00110826D1|nr:single-stranded-DNA-specific exonuclease RecJ [Aquibacillus sediminis]